MMEERKKITRKEAQARPRKSITSNKKALFDFEVIQKIEVGIILLGSEVKSLREGKCNLSDAYANFTQKDNDELFIRNMHIPEYEQANVMNHDPKRMRKLLLSKREAIKLRSAVNEKGLVIIPLSIYFSGHLVKLELALAKPKKKYDKRESVKEREVKRDLNRRFKV